VNEVKSDIAHRIYANLAGMSRNTSDMSHWVDNAHLLGREAGTSVNRVFLSLSFCSPSMLRDPKNKPLPPSLYIPEDQSLLAPNDLVLYERMLAELEETEDIVLNEEKMVDQSFMDYINSYKMIIYGCRSLVLAQFGCKSQAKICAEKSIQFAKSFINQNPVYFAMALGLAYAVQVCKFLNHTSVYEEGLALIEPYRNYFPIVNEILAIITHDPHQYHKDDKVIDSPPLPMNPSHNIGQTQQLPFYMIPPPYIKMNNMGMPHYDTSTPVASDMFHYPI